MDSAVFEKERNEFKEFALSQGAEWCYVHYYQISFYENVYEYLESRLSFSDEDIEDFIVAIVTLINAGKLTIADMWDDFYNDEFAECTLWENLDDFMLEEADRYWKE